MFEKSRKSESGQDHEEMHWDCAASFHWVVMLVEQLRVRRIGRITSANTLSRGIMIMLSSNSLLADKLSSYTMM